MVAIKKQRVPESVNGIQYNCCKNPKCSNFGVPVPDKSVYGNNPYIATSSNKGDKKLRSFRCNVCNEFFVSKSNQAIYEEFLRLTDYLKPVVTCCPDSTCSNHNVPLGTKKAYASYGTQKSGAKRYRCNACSKVFTVSLPTYRQVDQTYNNQIFKLLVNKMPLNRIKEVTGVSWGVLYHRINFIHQQCMAFVSQQERQFKDKHIPRLYLSVDRQEYQVNWTQREDRKNVILNAIATADNSTGYVFGINPNFDKDIDREKAQIEALETQDELLEPSFRKFARIWLESDYATSLANARKRALKTAKKNKGKKELPPATLDGVIQKKYSETEGKVDSEVSDVTDGHLPDYGVQVKAEYTMFGHFLAVKSLFGNVGKYRFFLDQDSGIRGAFMNAYKDEVKNKTADAFYVSIDKDLTVDEKRHLLNDTKKLLKEFIKVNPQFDEEQAKLELLKQSIVATKSIGKWGDKWVSHPIPTMSEPLKKMCWLTEDDTMNLDHKAWLYNKASLHSVDNFFQKVRRRTSMLERPIHSASAAGRTWNGYGAYDPAMVVKLLDIFRVVHNFIDNRSDKKLNEEDSTSEVAVYDRFKSTPAMRIGLVDKVLTYEEVLNFNL